MVGTSDGGISGDKTEPSRGYSDLWVVKLNPNGSIAWNKTIGTDESELTTINYGFAMEVLADGSFILCVNSNGGISGDKTEPSRGSGDWWVVKLNLNGSIAWDKTIGTDQTDYLNAMEVLSDGSIILGGTTRGGISGDKTRPSRGGSDFWVVKLNSNGSIAWDKTIGTDEEDGLEAMKVLSDGSIILGGYSKGGISGEKTEVSRGEYDSWVVKLNPNGSIAWDKTIGSAGDDYLSALEVLSDGSILLDTHSTYLGISGDKKEARGYLDYWVVKLNPNGSIAWNKIIGSADNDFITKMKVLTDGSILLIGGSNGGISGDKTESSRGESDFWVVKLNPNGSIAWDKTIGSAGYDYLIAVEVLTDGSIIMVGTSDGDISGEKTEASRGEYDFWVVKYSGSRVGEDADITTTPMLSLFPNPNKGFFKLMTGVTSEELKTAEVFDVTGKLILRSEFKESEQEISLENAGSGIYLLRVQIQGQVYTSKFVVE